MSYSSAELAPEVAAELGDSSVELSANWRRRSRLAPEPPVVPADAAAPEPSPRRGEPDGGAALVRAIARSLAEEVSWRDDVMRSGWQMGVDAHQRDGSLHHLLRALDVLGDVLLQRAGSSRALASAGTAADGVEVARRLSRAVSLLRLAATRGYMQAMMDTLRDRFRTIRHDIRNPLGTIRTAVALMDDETLPPETRASPRVRAMVARNARSIDEMLRTTLGDAAAVMPAFADPPLTLRAIACAVRNDLAGEASRNGVDIVVGDSLPATLVDGTSLELALTSVVLAMLRKEGASASGAEVAIELADSAEQEAAVVVEWRGADRRMPELDDLSFARELSERIGGSLTLGSSGQVVLRVPLTASDEERRSRRSAPGERDDVASAGKGKDLQPGRL